MPDLIRRRTVALGSAIATAVVVASLLQSDLARPVLHFIGLASDPQPFLELYFADPVHHPYRVQPGEAVPVSFVMAAHGSTYESLAWGVETIEGTVVTPDGHGTATVPDGESRSVTTTVRVPCAHTAGVAARTQVRVSVADPAQEIHFWVTCATSGR